MAFLKRVFSSDYRRALAAEAAGEYAEAARAYALAGERSKVAEMHLLAAERGGGRQARIDSLRAAARWSAESSRDVQRRVGGALADLVRAAGVVTEGDRSLLREAAGVLARAGDGAGAGACFELLGDEPAAALAYQGAGEVERLERLLGRDEERRHHERRLREASADYRVALAMGARTRALELLRECARLDPAGPSRDMAHALAEQRLDRGTVALRHAAAAAPVRYAGTFPVAIGRDPACEVPLHDARVSRRHAEIVIDGGRFHLRDGGSRNGTRLAGVVIDGVIPLDGAGRIGLGDAIELGFRVEPARTASLLRLEVTRGADLGAVAWVGAGPHALCDGAAVLRFDAGVPLVEAAGGAAALRLNQGAARPAGSPPIELIRGDRLELVAATVAGQPVIGRLDVE